MSTAMEEPLPSSPITTTSSSSSSSSSSSAHRIAIKSGSAGTPAILARLTAALALAAVSLWANYEASKSVDISIVNSAAGTHAGRRFDLDFVSNGRANRIIYRASQYVDQVLYSDAQFPRKQINHITLHLAGTDLVSMTSISPGAGAGDYTIHLSPTIMSAADADVSLASAVHRAVARLWLWDGQLSAPEPLLEAVADYLTVTAGFRLSSHTTCNVTSESIDESCWSVEFLQHCEAWRRGFVARLNRGMQERWAEFVADDALGSPVWSAYAAYWTAAGHVRAEERRL